MIESDPSLPLYKLFIPSLLTLLEKLKHLVIRISLPLADLDRRKRSKIKKKKKQTEGLKTKPYCSPVEKIKGVGKMLVVERDDDLGLSLSLSSSETRNALQLNLMPSMVASSSHFQKGPWNDVFGTSGETRPFLRGIDVNRAPSAVDVEEEAEVSSPNSTLSSISGKRSERDPTGEENEVERACSRGLSDEEDGDGSRKKLRLSKDQSAVLEESFKEHNTLNPKQKLALAKQLNLRPRQVEVWFQNRRARTKLKQTEVDCEYLKRCCENLTEENRRLQKEVQELRALKLSPQFYMHMTPPTTLTMCPSCERVALSSHATNTTTPQTSSIPIPPWAAAASAPPPPIRAFDTPSRR